MTANVAIDLGSANTLVFMQGRGIVYNEPTVVAMNSRSGEVLAVGEEAWRQISQSPGNLVPVRPMRRGVITDFELTRAMLRLVMRRIGSTRFQRPRAVVTVPAGSTKVERRAVEDAVAEAGARSVMLVEESLAAAVGAGLPIQEPVGNLVVNVGGGSSEAGVIAMGGLVTWKSVQVGGFDMDAAIQRHLRQAYGIAVGDAVAERIKVELGSAYPAADAAPVVVRGREMTTAVPRTVTITPGEIREALGEQVQAIVDVTKTCLAESPPELSHDVLERGIFLTGGGGMLRGLEMRLSQECEVPVHLTEEPLSTVATGAGHLLSYLPDFRQAFVAAARWG